MQGKLKEKSVVYRGTLFTKININLEVYGKFKLYVIGKSICLMVGIQADRFFEILIRVWICFKIVLVPL